jgi:hypothetical protein
MAKEELWIALRNRGYSTKATAAILGNAMAESGCECDRVQGDFTTARALSKTYTAQVDSGAIDRGKFSRYGPNGGGYGLVQWTYPTRKLGLYDTAKRLGVSIGSEKAAVEWLHEELHQPEYASVLSALQSDRSIREMSDVFMHQFERPADQSEAACAQRYSFAQAIYDQLGGDNPSRPDTPGPDPYMESDKPAASGKKPYVTPVMEFWPPRMLDEGMEGPDVQFYQAALLCHGYSVLTANGIFDASTTKAVKAFQAEHGLDADGVIGPLTGGALLRL